MQKAIWIVTFFIIIIIGWLIFDVDKSRVAEMSGLAESDEELSGDVNSWGESYNRLELKWEGTSKHVQTLQVETKAHYAAYAEKMDSINIAFEEIKFSIEQLEDVLIRKIDRVKDDVANLEDSFESYKRKNDRSIRELKQKISTIRDDINTLNITVFPPVEEEDEKKK